MSKIAIIVQRYGLEVNGGAEHHARILAEKLKNKHNITVLSTKAIDYISWDNYYTNTIETINGVTVKRFKTDFGRNHDKLEKLKKAILKHKKHERLLSKYRLIHYLDKKFNIISCTPKQSEKWLHYQGPYCPDMIEYLKKNKEQYDVFIFFTYLYYPTAMGMKEVKEKSIFIPTAHNEPELFAKTYESVFESAKFIMYNTLSEKRLIESTFKKLTICTDVAGIGIDPITDNPTDKTTLNINYDYFLYIGRVDTSKNCNSLYLQFLNYKRKTSVNIKLIFIGKNHTNLQPTDDIIFTGFIDEECKNNLLNNAKALIIPSKFESLSMALLEAMSRGKIVVANGDCEVLKDHIVNSGSGFFYHSDKDLYQIFNSIINMSKNDINFHSENAKKYINDNYSWNRIIDKFDHAIEIINNTIKQYNERD